MKQIYKTKEVNNILKQKLSITISKNTQQILDKYSKYENRSLSNMIEQMIKAYDEIHKTKY